MRVPNPVRLGSRDAPPPRRSQKRTGTGPARPQAPQRSPAAPASGPGVTVARPSPAPPAARATPPPSRQAPLPSSQRGVDSAGTSTRSPASKRRRVEEKGKGVAAAGDEAAQGYDNAIDQMPQWIAASTAMVSDLGDSTLFNEVLAMANPARLKKFAELFAQVMAIAPLATYSCIQELTENNTWEQRAKELEAGTEPLRRQVVELERQLAEKERALQEEVKVREEQMGILQTQCSRARREIESLRSELDDKEVRASSLARELRGAKNEAAHLRGRLENSEAEKQTLEAAKVVLEEDLQDMEASFNDHVQKRAEDTLYGFWFHYPDLDFSRVDPSYEEKASEWRAEKAAAQGTFGGGETGPTVPAESSAGDGLDPLFTPPVRGDELPPPPPPVDEPAPIPPPPVDDPAPTPPAEADPTLPEPHADPIFIVDLSPVREGQQAPEQHEDQDSRQGA